MTTSGTLTATRPTIDVILSRRSATRLVEPAPSAEQLDVVLRAATTVPDHGALHPWRFVVVTGAGRDRFADALVAAAQGDGPQLDAGRAAKVSGKAYVAPMCVVVVASPTDDHKVPEWEQVASASCAGTRSRWLHTRSGSARSGSRCRSWTHRPCASAST
jgi:nitroreductase